MVIYVYNEIGYVWLSILTKQDFVLNYGRVITYEIF